MAKTYVTLLGKTVRSLARLRGGSGSALPGLVVEKIDPQFIPRTLAQLPLGVVLVSGTNGKTTTVKMIVELLESQGLRVFTNRSGSNFTRGVAAALLSEVNMRGKLQADIAVLELDEAYAVHFVKQVKPRFSLLLNVMRDQLDRFGEIDTTAKLLATIATHTSVGVILNREDPRIRAISKQLTGQKVSYFGLDDSLQSLFPDDDSLHDQIPANHGRTPKADVILHKIDHRTATFLFDKIDHTTSLQLSGIYNIFNSAAALAVVRQVLGEKIDTPKLLQSLSHIQPAFGRGETITINGQPIELVLVKNPSGFRLGLRSFPPTGYQTMIAINDNYADGRDMSWLWDVSFDSLKSTGVALTSGTRAYDMALRLYYDEIPLKAVEPSLQKSLHALMLLDGPKRIYCTYTAMLALRHELSTLTPIKEIDQ